MQRYVSGTEEAGQPLARSFTVPFCSTHVLRGPENFGGGPVQPCKATGPWSGAVGEGHRANRPGRPPRFRLAGDSWAIAVAMLQLDALQAALQTIIADTPQVLHWAKPDSCVQTGGLKGVRVAWVVGL